MSRAKGNLTIFSRILNGSLPRRLAIVAFVATYALPQSGEAAAKVVPWMDAQRLLSECSSPSGSSGDKTCEDYIEGHCRPVKQAMSADKGMILNAILAN